MPETREPETLQRRMKRLFEDAAALVDQGDLGGAVSAGAEARMSWEDAGCPEEAEDA